MSIYAKCCFIFLLQRSAAQVPRVKELMPPNYANVSTSALAFSPDTNMPNIEQQHTTQDDVKTESLSFHDQKFLNVLRSCGNTLSDDCKKKLLQAYRVSMMRQFSQRDEFKTKYATAKI